MFDVAGSADSSNNMFKTAGSAASRKAPEDDGHKSSSDNLNNETHNFPGNRLSQLQQQEQESTHQRKGPDLVLNERAPSNTNVSNDDLTLVPSSRFRDSNLNNTEKRSLQNANQASLKKTNTQDIFKVQKFEMSLSTIKRKASNASSNQSRTQDL